jgi:RsiW-degrading membrane proteinase PrsW (M82 family)
MASRPGGPYQQRMSDRPTKSQLLPFLGQGKEVIKKAYFIPYAVLFIAGFLTPQPFLWFLALGLAAGCYYLVYRLCGKKKPIWLPLVPGLITAGILSYGLGLFNAIFSIPATIKFDDLIANSANIPYPDLFYNVFVQVGLKEELMKAVPVLLFAFFAPRITQSFGRDLEIREPLDGILIATGSALGFTMVETMTQYVPLALQQSGFVSGLNLLLVRVGAGLSGHVAYSGYFGYFIGLAMLKPQGRWKTIGIGWLFAAVMHTLWDSIGNDMLMLAVGLVSYVLLGAAILKARQISPTRAQNFATQIYHSPQAPVPQPSYAGAPAAGQYSVAPQMPQFDPGPPAPPAQQQNFSPHPPLPAPPAWPPAAAYQPAGPVIATPPPAPAATMSSGLTIFLAGQRIPLSPGRQFTESEIPGLHAAAGDGNVAEVTRHPADPAVLGLRNTSTVSWTAWTPNGESREIPGGKTIRLSPGTTIQFGNVRGEILA